MLLTLKVVNAYDLRVTTTNGPSQSTSDDNRTALVAELATLSREGNKGSARWVEVQNELAGLRVDAARSQAGPPARQSVRTRVIKALLDAPGSTPSQLAISLNKTTTVVSRVLAGLLEDGVVEYVGTDDDRRKRHYALTEAATGPDGDVAAPTDDEAERQHIALAIGVAVEARRKRHDLEYARDRLERLLNQATEIGAADLALLARTELITTLRQQSRSVPARESARQEHIMALAAMVRPATTSAVPAYLVAPALGCLEYQLGRDKTKTTAARLRHLTAAEVTFARCEDMATSHDWAPREGWSLLMRAELWRKQTEFGKAQNLALQASGIFQRYDDRYGAAEAFRVLGFCQRLRGDFDGAIATLEHALALEGSAVSDRCRADVLLQLGDAYRCKGQLNPARFFLAEAEQLSESLGRTITLGFVLSSLAAVEYADESLDAAKNYATRAAKPLQAEPGGLAMNTRRLAVICRELAASGDRAQVGVSVDLFQTALAGYRELDSPAGAAACLVGYGKLSGEEEDAAVGELMDLASSTRSRMLLPKDPWLPGLVSQWAEETARDDVQEVVNWTFKDDLVRQVAPEMAAEPRVLSTVDAA